MSSRRVWRTPAWNRVFDPCHRGRLRVAVARHTELRRVLPLFEQPTVDLGVRRRCDPPPFGRDPNGVLHRDDAEGGVPAAGRVKPTAARSAQGNSDHGELGAGGGSRGAGSRVDPSLPRWSATQATAGRSRWFMHIGAVSGTPVIVRATPPRKAAPNATSLRTAFAPPSRGRSSPLGDRAMPLASQSACFPTGNLLPADRMSSGPSSAAANDSGGCHEPSPPARSPSSSQCLESGWARHRTAGTSPARFESRRPEGEA